MVLTTLAIVLECNLCPVVVRAALPLMVFSLLIYIGPFDCYHQYTGVDLRFQGGGGGGGGGVHKGGGF